MDRVTRCPSFIRGWSADFRTTNSVSGEEDLPKTDRLIGITIDAYNAGTRQRSGLFVGGNVFAARIQRMHQGKSNVVPIKVPAAMLKKHRPTLPCSNP